MGAAVMLFPPGHFYSPIASLADVDRHAERLFRTPPRTLPGIELREDEQLALLSRLEPFYDEQPWSERRMAARRYFFENPAYSYSDALFLYCMIRHARPQRIIEIGSGYSSCAILDTSELFFGGKIQVTCIEPYPKLLRSLIREGDLLELIEKPLQDVSVERFAALESGDILFIDSTHVAKIGSDVNYIFAEILPALARGVYVHVHDIFYPFEYPKAWVYEGRSWNEAYMLRAFLTCNREFEITLFNTFLERFHRDYFAEHMPLCLKNEGGSIWLRRV